MEKKEVGKGATRSATFDAKERAEIRQRYNLGNILRSLRGETADIGFEKEISEETNLRDSGGRSAMPRHGGITVPEFLLGDIRTFGKTNDTTNDVSGNGAALVATDLRDDLTVSPLEARLVLTQLGVQYLDNLQGDVAIPKAGSVSAYWINAENGDATDAAPTFTQLVGKPHTCGAYVDITRRLALQTSARAQKFVGDLVLSSLARALEQAAVAGTGTNGQPLGLVGTSGVTAISGITAGSPTRANILDFIAAIEGANADTNNMKWLASSAVKAKLAKTLDADSVSTGENTTVAVGMKHLYEGGNVEEYPLVMSNITPAKKLILGDWSQMLVCRWGSGIDLMVDPYSKSTAGGIRLVAFLDADVVVRQPEAFAVGTILA